MFTDYSQNMVGIKNFHLQVWAKGVAAKQLKGVVWLAAHHLAFAEEDLKYGEPEKQAKSVYCVARGEQEYQIW